MALPSTTNKNQGITLKIQNIALLLALLPVSFGAGAIDFNKPSADSTEAAENAKIKQTIKKEKLFDLLCEKADLIQKAAPPKEVKRMLRELADGYMVISGTICLFEGFPAEKQQWPACQGKHMTIVGGLTDDAFFNSYGPALRNDKECQDVRFRLGTGMNALIQYHTARTPANENQVLLAVESARQLPKKCRDMVVDFLAYADKRYGACIK